jgi:lysyl-tRNA synthetase class 2
MEVLSKAIRTLPDKWAGVADMEIKQRQRYLDLITSEETRKRFTTRSKLISFIRHFLDENDFVEVETPILQAAACGASARPFITKHNALDRDFYLRISPETYLKRLVAGSIERVYELGRNFRNEGMDGSHLQEFTMLEWYAAYWDYQDNMRFVRELIQKAVEKFCGQLVINYQGKTLDFSGDWEVIDYREAVKAQTGIDLHAVRTVEALKDAIQSRGIAVDLEGQVSYGGLVDSLYKRTVRPNLIQPTFLVNHPVELVPLARRNDEDPTRLDMFQVVVDTVEIVKAYSELVDPLDQRSRLEEQMALRQAGDEESMMLEEDFLECMEYGMPPISGLGLGIDRFVAFLTDAPTLRDVVLFPPMREAGK